MEQYEFKQGETTVITNRELGFTLAYIIQDFWVMNFKAYQIIGTSCNGKPAYPHPNDEPMGTTTLTEASVFLSGYIRANSCWNIFFDEQRNKMLHFCGYQDVQRLGKLIDLINETALQSMAGN